MGAYAGPQTRVASRGGWINMDEKEAGPSHVMAPSTLSHVMASRGQADMETGVAAWARALQSLDFLVTIITSVILVAIPLAAKQHIRDTPVQTVALDSGEKIIVTSPLLAWPYLSA